MVVALPFQAETFPPKGTTKIYFGGKYIQPIEQSLVGSAILPAGIFQDDVVGAGRKHV